MTENKQLAKNMSWSMIVSVINYMVSFILTPYITQTLGIEAYGFISLSHTFTTYIDIITVALNAFAARYIAIEYHNSRIDKARTYFNSVLVADAFLLAIISFPIFAIIIKLDVLLVIPQEIIREVKILFLLVYINYCINIFGTLFSSLIFIKNQTNITYKNKGISTVLYAFLIAGAILSIGLEIYSIAVAQIISTILYLIANIYSSRKVMPEITIDIRNYSRHSIKEIISSGIWNSFNNIGAVLNNGLDLLVTNRMLTNTIMGQVSVGKQLSNIFNSVSVLVVHAFQPKQLEYYSKGDKDSLVKSLIKSIKTSGVLGCTIYGAYVILGQQFLKIWMGNEAEYIYYLGLIALSGDIMQITNRPLFYVFTLTNKLKINCWITLVTGMLNFTFMLVFMNVTNLGGYIVVGSTSIAYALTIWCISLQARKYLNLKKNPFNFYIIRNYLTAIALLIGGLLLNQYIRVYGWISFALWAIPVGLSTFGVSAFAILSKNERKSFRNAVIGRLKRGKV
jgi:O-antigen/teichoic acid export membrane protein|nr:oligosaccharide flippase family protein [uncultured Acetatifactor sp.]